MKYELMWRPIYNAWNGAMFDDLDQAERSFDRLVDSKQCRDVELTERATGRVLRTTRPLADDPDQ